MAELEIKMKKKLEVMKILSNKMGGSYYSCISVVKNYHERL